MGEVIQHIDSKVKILDEKGILAAAKYLMCYEDELGRGFDATSTHYSFLSRAEPDEWETGFDALAGWRFPVRVEEEDVWTEFDFTGEKIGQEELLFGLMKPYADGALSIETDYDRVYRYTF